jgi:hypothetical protein
MSTPPPQLSSPPEPPPRKRSTLAKASIIFAVVLTVTFGLCSVTMIESSRGMDGPVFPISLVIVAICAIGLCVCGIAAVVRLFTNRSSN